MEYKQVQAAVDKIKEGYETRIRQLESQIENQDSRILFLNGEILKLEDELMQYKKFNEDDWK